MLINLARVMGSKASAALCAKTLAALFLLLSFSYPSSGPMNWVGGTVREEEAR